MPDSAYFPKFRHLKFWAKCRKSRKLNLKRHDYRPVLDLWCLFLWLSKDLLAINKWRKRQYLKIFWWRHFFDFIKGQNDKNCDFRGRKRPFWGLFRLHKLFFPKNTHFLGDFHAKLKFWKFEPPPISGPWIIENLKKGEFLRLKSHDASASSQKINFFLKDHHRY